MGTSLLVFCDGATREQSSLKVYITHSDVPKGGFDESESGLPGLIRRDQRCGWALLKFDRTVIGPCACVFVWSLFSSVRCVCVGMDPALTS